jgi:antirestriction protein
MCTSIWRADRATSLPRVYVACLASYNAGRLHGEWIDATDLDELQEAVAEMLKCSPEPHAEEWAIHDYEGFGDLRLSEYESLERVAELAAAIDEHGLAFAAYASHVGEHYATPEGFEEAYCSEWRSEQEYAEELLDDLGELRDDSLASCYFDYEAFARDLFMGDYYSTAAPGGLVYVFRSL